MGEEIAITYETLFDLVRREKNREELQKLHPNFFTDVAAYLKDKISLVEGQKDKMFSDEEREKAMIQIQSIKKLIRELYERRERKIINLALVKARTEGTLLDTSALLEEEQALFAEVNNVITKYRLNLLATLVNPWRRSMSRNSNPATIETRPEAQPAEMSAIEQAVPHVQLQVQQEEEHQEESEPLQGNASFPQTVTVRFLHAVPAFVGKSMEVYGPFVEDDMAKLPKDIADILVQKGRAELFEG